MTPFTTILVAVGLLAAYTIGFCRGWRSRNGDVERMREALTYVNDLNAKGLAQLKEMKDQLHASNEERDALRDATQRAAAVMGEALDNVTGLRA